MTLATYAELQTAVADFLNREDLAAAIPTFIALAEARIARDLSHWKQEKRVTASFDEQFELIPNDLIAVQSMYHEDGDRITAMVEAEMHDRRGAINNAAGKPYAVRLTAGQFELFPAPDGVYPVSILYRARIPALSDLEPDNWLLRDAADVYLYATLAQSAPYLKDDARIQVWAALYQSGIDALNAESKKVAAVGAPRMGVPR